MMMQRSHAELDAFKAFYDDLDSKPLEDFAIVETIDSIDNEAINGKSKQKGKSLQTLSDFLSESSS